MKQPEYETIGEVLYADVKRYADGRKFAYTKHGKKKISPEDLRKEVMVARILGEMSGAERVTSSMVANPKWKMSDLSAAIQVFIVRCGEAACGIMKSNQIIGLEDVIEVHNIKGYNPEE